MRPTGIVRRIDDLGRVVIPKEIRQSLGIEAGDPLEIYTENNSVIFHKYGINDEVEKALNILSIEIRHLECGEENEKELYNLLKDLRGKFYDAM